MGLRFRGQPGLSFWAQFNLDRHRVNPPFHDYPSEMGDDREVADVGWIREGRTA
jgi:hypothetical protein